MCVCVCARGTNVITRVVGSHRARTLGRLTCVPEFTIEERWRHIFWPVHAYKIRGDVVAMATADTETE